MEMNELSTILVTILSTVAPMLGGGVLLYRRQNKRIKESEARLAEVSVEKAKVESKADEWDIWREQLEAEREHVKFKDERIEQLLKLNADQQDRHQEDIKNWEERFMNQTTYLRGVQRDLIAANEREKEHIRKEAQLEKERDHYKAWRCFREYGDDPEDCKRREPKQEIPIKYIPLDDIEEESDPQPPISPCVNCGANR